MNIVFKSEAQVLASNATGAWTWGFSVERFAASRTTLNDQADANLAARLVAPMPMACGWIDGGAPRGAVMLHLRARYVSKAAILTDLALRVLVVNRSPA